MADKQRRIVCAAVMLGNGLILTSARHWDEGMHKIAERLFGQQWPDKDEVQGFIDQCGTFFDRHDSWLIAEAAGQILYRCGGDETNGGTLYSENLY